MTATFASASTFSEILIATDFSDASDNALGYAKALARAFNSELLLVHVVDPLEHITVPEAAWADDSARIQCELETTQSAGAALRAEGLRVKDLCVFGGVANEVTHAGETQHADLIVTGTHCRKGVNRLLFGSEAESILKTSRVPVLIVGPKAALAPADKFVFRFIACAVTLDEHGADIASFAKHFADEHNAKLQVVSFPFYEPTQETDGYWTFKTRLQNLVTEEAVKKISPLVLSEPPSDALVELAIARDADLIVFDHHGKFLNSHLGGCLLTDVLATAPCPILAIPNVEIGWGRSICGRR
jgi:nucleotide-binding universal stress UspA family protein